MNVWHTDWLNKLNAMLYDGVLTVDNIVTDEVSKKYRDDTYFGFVLQCEDTKRKVKTKYFLPTEAIDKLPIKVTSKQKFCHKSDVYYFIGGAESIKIPAEPRMNFRGLVDTFAEYSHSVPVHWKLFKIVALAAYFERLNIRVVSEASFGKDGVVDIIQLLNGGVANLYKATLAKLKYSLRNDFIVINELGALTPTECADMQTYLLQAGAYKPRYENNSRSVAGTKEVMDMTNKSHIIFHNTPYYYENKGQPYFEQMFTASLMDRFPPLLFDGYVTEDFTYTPTVKDLTEDKVNIVKDVIATINYYKENNITEFKYKLSENFFEFKGKEKQRALRSFKVIAKYVAEYAEDEKEFVELLEVLKQCHKRYKYTVAERNKDEEFKNGKLKGKR